MNEFYSFNMAWWSLKKNSHLEALNTTKFEFRRKTWAVARNILSFFAEKSMKTHYELTK